MGREIAKKFFGRPGTNGALGSCIAFHGRNKHFKAMIAIFAVKFINRHNHYLLEIQNLREPGGEITFARAIVKACLIKT